MIIVSRKDSSSMIIFLKSGLWAQRLFGLNFQGYQTIFPRVSTRCHWGGQLIETPYFCLFFGYLLISPTLRGRYWPKFLPLGSFPPLSPVGPMSVTGLQKVGPACTSGTTRKAKWRRSVLFSTHFCIFLRGNLRFIILLEGIKIYFAATNVFWMAQQCTHCKSVHNTMIHNDSGIQGILDTYALIACHIFLRPPHSNSA